MIEHIRAEAETTVLNIEPNKQAVQSEYLRLLEERVRVLESKALEGDTLDDFVDRLIALNPERAIQIIVLIRKATLLGLKEAKDLFDSRRQINYVLDGSPPKYVLRIKNYGVND